MLQANDWHSHIVFIDSAVDDYPSLVKGVVSGAEVIVLTPTLDGVTQISEILANRLDIASVHIVSHGSPGCLYLGKTQLSLDTLERYVAQLQTWFSGLLPQAIAPSLLLYGCNVAAGDAGEEFLERLQQLTGANIAASAGRIGNAAKEGSWHLERHLGEVDIDSAFVPELMQVYSGVFATSEWIARGPAPANNGSAFAKPDNQVTGAIHTVLADPSNPNILYIGAVNGGIWKTENALITDDKGNTIPDPTITWKPLTDKFPSLSIGAMEFDPTDDKHQTIVAGIGPFSAFPNVGGSGYTGGPLTGLLLTTDGGNSFTQITDPLLQGKSISGVAKRGDIILAASNNGGVYRSKDNGKTWAAVLDSILTFDLVGDPSDSKRFYASNLGGIYLSPDSGESWEKISDTNSTLKDAIVPGKTSNLEMAVSRDEGRVYVNVITNSKSDKIAYSDNQGISWTIIDPKQVNPRNQGDLHSSIAVDPKDKNIVYIGGDAGGLFRRNVSSETEWTSLTSSSAPHADSREMTFDRDGKLIEVDDGGIYRRDNPTGNGDWFSINGNLQVTEIHDIAYDPVSKIIISGNQDNGITQQTASGSLIWNHVLDSDGGDVAVDIITRANVNQSVRYSSSQDLGDFRREIYDAGNKVVPLPITDATNEASIVITSPNHGLSTGAQVAISKVQGNTAANGNFVVNVLDANRFSIQNLNGQPQSGNGKYTGGGGIDRVQPALTVVESGNPLQKQFITPIAVNSVAGSQLIIAGAKSVYESLDQGNTLKEIKPSISVNSNVISNTLAYGGRRNGVDNPNVLYASSSNQVFVRTDANGTLNPTEPLPGAGFITDIVLDSNDWMTAFAIDNDQVFQTTSAGLKPEPPKQEPPKQVWADITNNLQSIATKSFTTDLKLQPTDLNLNLRTLEYISKPGRTALDSLVVGTNFGVFSSNRGSDFKNWSNFGTALPNAPVWDLDYDPTDDVLVAGTLGRGAWSLPDASKEALSAINTIKVDSLEDVDDDNLDIGHVSLREAIRLITSGGEIKFDQKLSDTNIGFGKGTIGLTKELVINKGLTINGLGADKLTISGIDASRVFKFDDETSNLIEVGIKNLTIASGNASEGEGGGIFNREKLTVSDSILSSNRASSGGGIENKPDSTLILSKSTLKNNQAGSSGGGIDNSGNLTVNNSTLSNNTAEFFGGGINNFGNLTVNNSTISGNKAKNGGGIEHLSNTTLIVGDSTISDNTAKSFGGGIDNFGDTVILTNSTVSSNKAGENGGGINNFSGKNLTVLNSTISSNQAGNFGGGIQNGKNLTVKDSTITANTADSDSNGTGEGGGINNFSTGTAEIANTIVAKNFDNPSALAQIHPDVSGSFTNTSFNLIGDGTGSTGFTNGVNGNQVGKDPIDPDPKKEPIDPKLGRLQDNGGPTQTHALLPDSRAIDKGNNANIPADITTDQRGPGFPRIIGSKVDIGAFEAPLPSGSGGKIPFVINRGDNKTITDFGGIGTGSNPSAAVRAEVDTLKFVGTGLTARNLLLTQNGVDLEITFEGVADTKVTLQNFPLENLENLTDLGNILFNGQNSIQDSFDVVNADSNQPQIFNRNTVTFLNDLNNDILGFDNSDDVINGQEGNDKLDGRGGNDLLRGNDGNDTLLGGIGNDILVGGAGDDSLDLGVDSDMDTVVYRSGDGSDTVRNFKRGTGGDKLDFQNIAAIDVVVNGNSTLFRLSDGIKDNGRFGTGDPLLRLSGTTGFTAANLSQNLVAGNTKFLFA